MPQRVAAMELQSLTLANFKNIASVGLEFSPKINCFLGNNGMGKSNLLDAIYMLSFTKSFTGMTDQQVIMRGETFTTARAMYQRHDTSEELTMGLAVGKRKSLKRAGKEYKRLSDHIGVYPLVLVAPHDIDLVRGSGEERRRWMDMVISQSNRQYLASLIRYNAAIEQRNKLLRDGVIDHTLYLAIEMVLDTTATLIHHTRARWVEELSRLTAKYYAYIAGDEAGTVSLEFEGSLHSAPEGSMQALLDAARRHDEIVKHTSVGPHRDDIKMLLAGFPMRRAASQGQCKTLTIALRLAQYEFLHQATGLRPLLLLDDVFDRLDATRVERIMSMVARDEFGQIFITDTNRKHLDDIISHTSGSHAMWTVADGVFTPVTLADETH